MTATARVTVLMSPEEKAALDAKAVRAGPVSAGELVRRAVAAYDETEAREAEELRALLDLFAKTHAKTIRDLDQLERKLDEVHASLSKGTPA